MRCLYGQAPRITPQRFHLIPEKWNAYSLWLFTSNSLVLYEMVVTLFKPQGPKFNPNSLQIMTPSIIEEKLSRYFWSAYLPSSTLSRHQFKQL